MRYKTVLAMAIFLSSAEIAEAGKVKRSGSVSLAEETVLTFSYISTLPESSSISQTWLLEDDQQGLLVVRRTHPDINSVAVLQFEHLGTGEILKFETLSADTTIISFGTNQVAIDWPQVFAEAPSGQGFPPSVQASVRALLANASDQFQKTLKNVAVVGCTFSMELYLVTVSYASLLYDDVSCHRPPGTGHDMIQSVVPDFDPQSTPPNTFEQKFGPHYYQ